MAPTDAPNLTIIQRVNAIKKAMSEVHELYEKHQVTDALYQWNGPQILQIMDTPIGSKVLVWHENKGQKGLFQLLGITDQTCQVQLPSGPTPF